MTKDQAVKHFGTQQALAAALGMSQGSVSLWKEYPPAIRQIQLEAITDGALKAEPGCALPVVKTSTAASDAAPEVSA
jgi:hypothetical protein